MSVLIKGGRIVTAADDYVADVLVDGERVTLIGESLDVDADRMIDAHGKYLLPGCVDPHTHLDMPFGGTTTIDDVESGQTAAAFGGTTTPRRLLHPGQGPDASPTRSRSGTRRREGKQLIDMGYHIAVTDLTWDGALEELATLPDQGVTSYKLFMAYKGALMVDDETLFRTMEVAAATGALVMVHAENGDAIDVLVKKALAEGHTEPHWHALTRPPETEGEATNRAIQLAHVAGCAALRRPRLVPGVGRADRARAGEGLERVGRDLHAVLLRRLHVPRAAELRGREVRLHAAAARQGEPGGALGRGAHRRALGDLDRPLRVQLGRPEDARPRRLLEDPERRARAREPAADDPPLRRPRGPDHAQPDGRAALRRTRRSCSASIRARARSPSAPTPTSSSSTRSSASRSPPRPSIRGSTTTSTRAPR